jgi:hypothetical protein
MPRHPQLTPLLSDVLSSHLSSDHAAAPKLEFHIAITSSNKVGMYINPPRSLATQMCHTYSSGMIQILSLERKNPMSCPS